MEWHRAQYTFLYITGKACALFPEHRIAGFIST
uniref:Uncharacterized protein n=1 Tax=Anguilla anguilla TaxID=7936 RepID=A0A0E9R5T8_ANGAN